MFKRNNAAPQRKPFSLSSEQIVEDIQAISKDEEHRNKLYYCLDEKPPQEHKFTKIEEFLKGTTDLEEISESLADLVYELDGLSKDVRVNVEKLRENATSALKKK